MLDSEGNPIGVYQHQPAMAANKGLELIGKELGMFKERIEHSGPWGAIEIATRDQRLLALNDEELGALKAVLLKCGKPRSRRRWNQNDRAKDPHQPGSVI